MDYLGRIQPFYNMSKQHKNILNITNVIKVASSGKGPRHVSHNIKEVEPLDLTFLYFYMFSDVRYVFKKMEPPVHSLWGETTCIYICVCILTKIVIIPLGLG